MDISEQILNELKQINITLSRIAASIPKEASIKESRTSHIDVEEKIRKARAEAEERISKFASKSGHHQR